MKNLTTVQLTVLNRILEAFRDRGFKPNQGEYYIKEDDGSECACAIGAVVLHYHHIRNYEHGWLPAAAQLLDVELLFVAGIAWGFDFETDKAAPSIPKGAELVAHNRHYKCANPDLVFELGKQVGREAWRTLTCS